VHADVRVGISVGIASYTDPMSSTDDVLALADRAPYEAKRRTSARHRSFAHRDGAVAPDLGLPHMHK
jgi:GGDEF domain-containing protein